MLLSDRTPWSVLASDTVPRVAVNYKSRDSGAEESHSCRQHPGTGRQEVGKAAQVRLGEDQRVGLLPMVAFGRRLFC